MKSLYMTSLFQSIVVLEDIIERLKALAGIRCGSIAQQHKTEVEALEWALEEIKHVHTLPVVLMVGSANLIRNAPFTLGAYGSNKDDVSVAILVSNSNNRMEIFEKIRSHFQIPPDWDGDKLPSDRLVPQILSRNYFALTRNDEKVLLVFGLIASDRTNPNYDTFDDDQVENKLRELFASLKWEEKRSV